METETKTRAGVQIRPNRGPSGELTRVERPRRFGATIPGRVDLNLDDLQAVVQYAYDQHGILATPSYTALAAELDTAVAEGRRYCQCGQAGCSDPDPNLSAFSQAWARSIGDAL